jgi:prepilin-type N-terminal cleavage/methylation domain-containing protein
VIRGGEKMKSQTTLGQHSAFTVIELLVVVAVLGMLAVITLPGLAGARTNSKAVHCLNNLKRLNTAWLMYASDHADRMVGNPSWVAGVISDLADSTNAAKLTDPTQSAITRYVQAADLFKCPADLSTTLGNPRVRSVALMSTMGGTSGSQANQIPGRTYFDARRITELNKPGPANTLTILDEHPASINDSMVYFRSGLSTANAHWVDIPASYHNVGAGVSFADGRAMIRRWQSSTTLTPDGGPVPGSLDYVWMNERAPYR